MNVDWLRVARDVTMILLVLFALVVAAAMAVGGLRITGALVASFLALTAGFCVSGCLTPRGRFSHLAVVAVGVWLLGTVLNSSIRSIPTDSWAMLAVGALLPVAGAMLLGGAISLAIVPSPGEASPPQDPSAPQV